MEPRTRKQLAVVLGSIVLFTAIWFLPETKVDKAAAPQASEHQHTGIKDYVDSVRNSFTGQEKIDLADFEKHSGNPDSISSFWNRRGYPAIAGYYLQELSEKQPEKETFIKAGNSFFLATRMNSGDLKHELYENAINSYEKALEKDPADLEVKTRLGVCYVEGTGEPMKGITHLLDVVAKDSTKVEAQMNLALFAIQSGQYDKAIARFNRITAMKPDFAEPYLYLGQTYATMGEKAKAAAALQQFSDMTDDSLTKAEVEKYIRELKNS